MLLSTVLGWGACPASLQNSPGTNAATGPTPPDRSGSKGITQWTPVEYLGLRPGKSTYNDVKRLFGEPRWEGEVEEEPFESDPETEILLQYSAGGPLEQATEVLVGSKSRLVKAISYIPNPPLSRSDAISLLGKSFYEVDGSDSLCRDKGQKHIDKPKYPLFLVYRDRGTYVFIGEDDQVKQLGILYNCSDR